MTPDSHYEKIGEAFGAPGFYCETPAEVEKAIEEAFALEGPSVINVKLASRAPRHMAKFAWLTRD